MFSCVRCASARGENASEGDVRGVSSPSSSLSSMGETKDEYGFTISPSARHAGEPRMMTSASMSASDARFWARVREDTSVLREGGCWAKRAIRLGVPRDYVETCGLSVLARKRCAKMHRQCRIIKTCSS